ncbi:thioredoxin domain-containing protein [Candidatus Woesearchaeota archaeon]|nr:thioredoxin domain-containing protein [Candidatus Woesearchaeota archaeon]
MKEELKENIIVLLIFVLIIGALVFWIMSSRSAPEEEDDVRYRIPLGNSPRLGDIEAPVVVVQFSDFECPYCGAFALQSFPIIREKYIDTGQVLFIYKQYPLTRIHLKAYRAALAAACAAEQDSFWEYHDILYENIDALEIGDLQNYASILELDTERFEKCFIGEELKSRVLEEMQAGIDASVTGTPTFFFNGRKVTGALSPEAFGAEVEAELTE